MNIAIFASGSGTNAENIVKYFSESAEISVKLIISNIKNAFVLERAKNLNVQSAYFGRDDFYKSENVLNLLENEKIDLIVLAGFLWLVPENLLKRFENRIINIHPALLPKFGGKGMYGMNVHKAVRAENEKESGITIHYVNEKYDDGEIIFQASFSINEKDTPETIAEAVHKLEYEFYPMIIENVCCRLPDKVAR